MKFALQIASRYSGKLAADIQESLPQIFRKLAADIQESLPQIFRKLARGYTESLPADIQESLPADIQAALTLVQTGHIIGHMAL